MWKADKARRHQEEIYTTKFVAEEFQSNAGRNNSFLLGSHIDIHAKGTLDIGLSSALGSLFSNYSTYFFNILVPLIRNVTSGSTPGNASHWPKTGCDVCILEVLLIDPKLKGTLLSQK